MLAIKEMKDTIYRRQRRRWDIKENLFMLDSNIDTPYLLTFIYVNVECYMSDNVKYNKDKILLSECC